MLLFVCLLFVVCFELAVIDVGSMHVCCCCCLLVCNPLLMGLVVIDFVEVAPMSIL